MIDKKRKKQLAKMIISFFLVIIISFLKIDTELVNQILYAIAYSIVGYDVVLKAIKNMLKGRLFDEHFLMTIATIGAFCIGEFQEAVAVMLFYQVGEFFQSYAVDKSRKSIADLMDIRPDYANVYHNNEIERVNPEQVNIGDIILVKPGEKIPLDGIVVEGESMLNTKSLTGESIPKKVSIKDEVLSGCINQDGILRIKVTKEFGESTVSKILDLVENAGSKKSQSEHFISKFAKYYTPIVVVIAVLLAILPPLFLNNASFQDWLYRACSFLVVSCPCALVISIPLSFFGGIGAASKKGILIKGSNYLEGLASTEIVVCDKTGTLTKGNLTISKVYNYSSYSDKKLLSILGGIEYSSTHPIAKGVISYIDNKKIDYNKNLKIKNISGYGLKTTIDGVAYFVGNEKLLKKLNINNDYISDLEDLKSNGNSIVYIIEDSNIIGLIGVKDTIRDNAKEVINTLKSNNIEVIMLTGDNKTTASIVGKELGITNIISDVIPKEKSNVIKKLKKDNKKIIMVGDGINDAPSLTISDIGISISSGTDIAMDSADVILMKDDLSKIIDFLNISKKTLRNIKQNLFWAFLYNICMIPIAMGLFINYGISINPMIACISMIISSLFVIFNALRLKK